MKIFSSIKVTEGNGQANRVDERSVDVSQGMPLLDGSETGR